MQLLGIYAIYAKYLMYIFGMCAHIMPYIMALASTIQQGALYTYLIFIMQQIWWPYLKYSIRCGNYYKVIYVCTAIHCCVNILYR